MAPAELLVKASFHACVT